MQTTHLDTVFTKALTPDHVRAILVLTKLRNIIRDHKLDQFYDNAIYMADQEINKMGDTTQAGRHAAIISLKENLVAFDTWNRERQDGQAIRYPETVWEMKHKCFFGSKIPAIKAYRSITGEGLAESKKAVEDIMEEIYSGKIEI